MRNLLADYLVRTGRSQQELARASGVPQSTISRVVLGGDANGRSWAKLARETDGEVTAERHWAQELRRKRRVA